MSLLTSLLSTASGGGSGTVQNVILLSALAGTTTALTVTQSGAGAGATLTNAGAQAAFSVDGVTPVVGSRILVKNQATASQNGVYTLTTVGSGATNWVLTRATDFNQPSQISVGVEILVASGTVNAGTAWVQTATVNTVDTDAITFIAQSVVGLTASRATVTSSGGVLTTSAVTATELGYLSGVTSAIQTQINSAGTKVVLISSATPSNAATVDFNGVFTSAYDFYLIELNAVLPASNANLLVRVGAGATPTYDTGSNYCWTGIGLVTTGPTVTIANGAYGATSANITYSNGDSKVTASGKGVFGQVMIFGPTGAASNNFYGTYQTSFLLASGTPDFQNTNGGFNNIAQDTYTSIRFYFSTGNIASGTLRLYGIKNS